MEDFYTWCFFTEVVCKYDQLDTAKKRYQRCVDVLREQYTVHFSSEQAYQMGQAEPGFTNLLSEIVPPSEDITPQDREDYSTFCFVSVIDVPNRSNRSRYEFQVVSEMLELDWEEGVPAVFPSRTRGIVVSHSGHEIDGCEFN